MSSDAHPTSQSVIAPITCDVGDRPPIVQTPVERRRASRPRPAATVFILASITPSNACGGRSDINQITTAEMICSRRTPSGVLLVHIIKRGLRSCRNDHSCVRRDRIFAWDSMQAIVSLALPNSAVFSDAAHHHVTLSEQRLSVRRKKAAADADNAATEFVKR